MEKNRTLQLRVSDYTIKKLNLLSDKLGLTKSEIIRRSLECMDEKTLDKMFGTDVLQIILPFNEAYEVVDFGIIDNNYLSGRGFWINLNANFEIGLTKGFDYGATSIRFHGREIYVNGGFLNDIQNALAIIYNSKR